VAVRIRLLRMGRKKKPFYRIIVVDSRRSGTSGSYLEKLGDYDPIKSENQVNIDGEKVKSWISKGALPSDRVKKILESEKII